MQFGNWPDADDQLTRRCWQKITRMVYLKWFFLSLLVRGVAMAKKDRSMSRQGCREAFCGYS